MGEAQIYCTSSILFTGSLDEAAPYIYVSGTRYGFLFYSWPFASATLVSQTAQFILVKWTPVVQPLQN